MTLAAAVLELLAALIRRGASDDDTRDQVGELVAKWPRDITRADADEVLRRALARAGGG